MHYLTFVVVPKEGKEDIEGAVERIMAPYDENNEKEYEFKDIEEEYLERYETKSCPVVKGPDGTIYSPYDERFRPDKVTFSSEFVYPEGYEEITIPFKERYKTFDEFMDDYCDYEKEDGRYGYYHNPDGRWDWYQIGGRWTGFLDGYDPETDPDNIETCRICNGTGMRNDDLGKEARAKNPEYTCNGCRGKGVSVKWPTQWKEYEGDIAVINQDLIDSGKTPYSLVTETEWFNKETWTGKDFIEDKNWPETVKGVLSDHLGDYVVVVDFHS